MSSNDVFVAVAITFLRISFKRFGLSIVLSFCNTLSFKNVNLVALFGWFVVTFT